jgi:hypothetical protein
VDNKIAPAMELIAGKSTGEKLERLASCITYQLKFLLPGRWLQKSYYYFVL